MKERFIELVEKIDYFENLFHQTAPNPGFTGAEIDVIYDVQEFQLWLQELTLEVQDIVDRTGDSFATDTLKKLSSPFTGWNDRNQFEIIKGKILAMERNIEKYYDTSVQKADLPPRIFVSHSSKDIEYVSKLVALLDDMGLDQTQVFCSSLPGYNIPIDKDILITF